MIKTNNEEINKLIKDAKWITVSTDKGCYVENLKEDIEILEVEDEEEKTKKEIKKMFNEIIEKILGDE